VEQILNKNGLTFEVCYRCGKVKLATFNRNSNPSLDYSDLEMTKMGWNARGPKGTRVLGKYCCKNCKTETKFSQRCTWDNNDNLVQIKLVYPNTKKTVGTAFLCSKCGRVYVFDNMYKKLKVEATVSTSCMIEKIIQKKRAKIEVIDNFWMVTI